MDPHIRPRALPHCSRIHDPVVFVSSEGGEQGRDFRAIFSERPVRGGSVASGPRTERMQAGAVGGGDLVRRGGLAKRHRVDGRNRGNWQICHVDGHGVLGEVKSHVN